MKFYAKLSTQMLISRSMFALLHHKRGLNPILLVIAAEIFTFDGVMFASAK